MNKIDLAINHAEKKCKANGSRLTDKRKQVLKGLLLSGKALSAYELAEYCLKEIDLNIPVVSVYRILDFLEGEQLVHKLKLANKFVACSHISCDHSHEIPQFLICNECQSVKEISINKSVFQSLQENVKEAGYHMVSSQIEMNCICNNCISKAA